MTSSEIARVVQLHGDKASNDEDVGRLRTSDGTLDISQSDGRLGTPENVTALYPEDEVIEALMALATAAGDLADAASAADAGDLLHADHHTPAIRLSLRKAYARAEHQGMRQALASCIVALDPTNILDSHSKYKTLYEVINALSHQPFPSDATLDLWLDRMEAAGLEITASGVGKMAEQSSQ